MDTVVDEIVGNEMVVTGVKARNVKTGNEFDLAADGVFIYVGLDPLTAPFREAGLTNEAGWIPTDNEMKTNIPGVFAIGDVREKICDKSLLLLVMVGLLDNKCINTWNL